MEGRTLLVEAIGAVLAIDGTGLTDDAWAAVEHAWSGALAPASTAEPVTIVTAHGHVGTASMLASLSMDVTLAALEHGAGDLLMLHAAGVALPDGGVVALVGPSGRGKTTAARHLGTRLGYVSDESVGITSDGRVLPYRKPLSIIEGDDLVKAQRSPDELGLKVLTTHPLRLAALVLLERSDDAGTPRVEALSPADALVGLAREASYLGRLKAPLATLWSHVEAVGGAHRITYRDVEALHSAIQQLAGRPTRPLAAPSEPVRPRDEEPTRAGRVGVTDYRRVDPIDAFALDDQLVLLVRLERATARIIVLDGIGPSIWAATARAATLPEIVANVVRTHGLPDGSDATALVTASVSRMLTAGLLSASS